jgi:hypothetical protein
MQLARCTDEAPTLEAFRRATVPLRELDTGEVLVRYDARYQHRDEQLENLQPLKILRGLAVTPLRA